jgi:hypothetical protein
VEIAKVLGVAYPPVFEFPEGQKECSNPDLVVGVEVEVENCGAGAGAYQRALNPLGWNVTNDGSLRGNAYEFVSQPMRIKHILASLEKFYAATKFTTEANFTDRCSIHVHVNCTNLTVPQLSAFALVYAVFEESIFDFIGGYRDTNIYCIPWNQCRFNSKLIHGFENYLAGATAEWQKYTAVNLLPLRTQGTVEFRHMHGTSDMDKITQWLNIIGCLFAYSTKTEFKQIYEIIKNINYISNYEQFFNQVFQGYWQFTPEIAQRLERGVISAKLSLVNYNPNKPEKKKKVTVTKSVYEDDEFRFARVGDPQLHNPGEGVRAVARPRADGRARIGNWLAQPEAVPEQQGAAQPERPVFPWPEEEDHGPDAIANQVPLANPWRGRNTLPTVRARSDETYGRLYGIPALEEMRRRRTRIVEVLGAGADVDASLNVTFFRT